MNEVDGSASQTNQVDVLEHDRTVKLVAVAFVISIAACFGIKAKNTVERSISSGPDRFANDRELVREERLDPDPPFPSNLSRIIERPLGAPQSEQELMENAAAGTYGGDIQNQQRYWRHSSNNSNSPLSNLKTSGSEQPPSSRSKVSLASSRFASSLVSENARCWQLIESKRLVARSTSFNAHANRPNIRPPKKIC